MPAPAKPPAPEAPPLLLPQRMVRIDQLNPTDGNPRIHDAELLDRSVNRFGQYKPIVVNRGTRTGITDQILAGHGTVEALRRQGIQWVQVSDLDVDTESATRILVLDNRSSDKATNEDRLLVEILSSLPDLDWTGYDPGDLDKLIAGLTPPLPPTPPDDFNDYDLDIDVKYGCPSCGYEWSGNPHPNTPGGTHTNTGQ
jgi:hypothetical protein